jgi:RNA:NAD 2'-phosphotransferase (TPT1/KptA family)
VDGIGLDMDNDVGAACKSADLRAHVFISGVSDDVPMERRWRWLSKEPGTSRSVGELVLRVMVWMTIRAQETMETEATMTRDFVCVQAPRR